MQHYSGHSDSPLRREKDVLKHLDEAADALTVQKLQVEALLHVADALKQLGSYMTDSDAGIMVALSNRTYDTLKVQVQPPEPDR